ncbi:MAG: virulence-associated E family protein, partial [Oscillospiraceae bacterium]|nr:virulence-associated E family protein [Oscillospiraceae bacterium]
LAMNHMYFGEGYTIDTRNKDDIIQVTSNWIVELGEIGSTMRKDMDSLKAFLTKSMDEYRAPYGRTSLKYPRKTSFVGTVNDEKYLIDETGNRRFATIPIKTGISLNYDTQIVPFDSLQFWAQIYSIVQAEIESGATIGGCFRLTDDEKNELEKRNAGFTKPLKGEMEVLDILTQIERTNPKQVEYKEVTVTEFKNYYPELVRYSTVQIGRVLTKLGFPEERKKLNGKTFRLRKLPYIKYTVQ